MINEIDYDQVGADTGGFVEIANAGASAATLDGIALVLVNGGDGTEYDRVDLTGIYALDTLNGLLKDRGLAEVKGL